jgi:hypothetical protein
MRTSRIAAFDAKTERFKMETINIVLGPDDDTDGDFLIQKEDGTFWTFAGSPNNGWYGGFPANWPTKENK